MKLTFTLIALLLSLQVVVNGQQSTPFINNTTPTDTSSLLNKVNLFTTEASYIGDFAGNFSGGKERGTAYLGMANIKIGFETKNIGLWDGGQFYINGASTHGRMPSGELFGDFQVASNIEAGNHTYLHELWYKHSMYNSEFTIGLQDLNAEFVRSEYAASFINSSFGVPSLISNNIPVPIFPLTALGITGKFQLNETLIFQAALFDGLPEDFESNQYNLNWELSSRNGFLMFTEFQLSTQINNLPGTIKAGGYFHSHLTETQEETGHTEAAFNENYGFYLIADQTVWQKNDNTKLGFFTQLAVSPGNINRHNYYIGGGFIYNGLFNQSGNDVLGLAFALAELNNGPVNHEMTIELFYKAIITGNLFIQPDFQYIINPAGTENKLDNALAAFIRFGINF